MSHFSIVNGIKVWWPHAIYAYLFCLGVVINYFSKWNLEPPVSIAARSKAITVFGRSNIGIAGSNPARGMDVCLCFFMLCCPVEVEAFELD
jgi:hypothetical protein